MKPLILDIPTIAVTGSSGKTMTKEMIASVLVRKMKTFKSKKNRNQTTHTRRHAKMIQAHHQAVVLEFAMGRRQGKKHCSIIQPNIGVITSIGTAHYGKLGNSIEDIVKSKSALIEYMKPTGILLINNDDDNSKLLPVEQFKGKVIRVGIKSISDFQAYCVEYRNNGMSFKVKIDNQEETFFIPVFGHHNVINALFAIAIAHHLNLTPLDINEGFKRMKIPKGRLNLIRLSENVLLIDDSFNANPQSVKAAIDVLSELGKEKTKVAVLGTMAELGEYSKTGHLEVGKYLANKQIDYLVTYKKNAEYIGQGAIGNGFNSKHIIHCDNETLLYEFVDKYIRPNTIILIKGSRVTQLDKVVKHLKHQYSRTTERIDSNANNGK
ncbi:UDP-N-acetylmuramoyl-tripeptide--D-alanyl-D-alanine ligase [Desulfofalx alkaliphila]|uniref:UDP-N-acetylmuramoyl-tripeptide--D-alanyl-D- alanine ligase n=1 Tax=Desulfofalx alkaliphila TaxID=105483 RepID=UPI00068B1332|nr:UDP-N-acetylmuramoyl-tripeptide--D-alanyl-D-alanine ligase [Desulfofalx alkaliphila]